MNPEAGARPAFPPSLVVPVKALACELPHRKGLPLSRFLIAELRQEVLDQGLVAEISGATIWRWLGQDAICPWRHRTWIFPRDPLFVEKAGPILDLYQGLWHGHPLGPKDFGSPPMKKPAFKRDTESILPFRPPPEGPLSLSAPGPGPISPPGMSAAPKFSAAASGRTAANPLIAWLAR